MDSSFCESPELLTDIVWATLPRDLPICYLKESIFWVSCLFLEAKACSIDSIWSYWPPYRLFVSLWIPANKLLVRLLLFIAKVELRLFRLPPLTLGGLNFYSYGCRIYYGRGVLTLSRLWMVREFEGMVPCFGLPMLRLLESLPASKKLSKIWSLFAISWLAWSSYIYC